MKYKHYEVIKIVLVMTNVKFYHVQYTYSYYNNILS